MLTGAMSFLLFVLVLLTIPLTLSFRVSWHQTLQGDIRFLWFFGLVRIPISLSRLAEPSEPNRKATRSIKSRSSASKKKTSFVVFHQRLFRKRMLRFIRDIWHAIGKKNLMIHLRLGLGDPADTGRLWAFFGPVTGMLATAKTVTIEVVPDFFEETVELDSSGEIRIVPLQILYLSAGLLLSPSVRRALKDSRAG